MSVSMSDRFSSRLKTVYEAPEPFRSALLQHLSPLYDVRLLVWGPASKSMRSKSPATLLALTNQGWIVVSEAQNNNTVVAYSDFANTLLIELTCILLYGRLKIDYLAENRVQFISIEFNTVMQKLYQEAVQLLLEGMDDMSSVISVEDKDANLMLDILPFKFRSVILDFSPKSQIILSMVHLPAVIQGRNRWIQRELYPQAVLLLTERELMLVSEEKTRSWFRGRSTIKYGQIVTYCPLLRMESFKLLKNQQIGALDIEICSQQCSEKLLINFPSDKESEVSGFMERAMQQKTTVRYDTQ